MHRTLRGLRPILLGGGLLVLAACAGQPAAPPGDLGFQWEVKRFYADRAAELDGQCTRPLIRTITRVRTVEEADSDLVKEIRYFWRDESVMRTPRRQQPTGGSISCQGFADRTFTFARLPDATLRAVAMDGERRLARQPDAPATPRAGARISLP